MSSRTASEQEQQDDDSSVTAMGSKRTRTSSISAVDVIFTKSEDHMICNVSIQNTLIKRGGHPHSASVEANATSKYNLKRHCETWHPEFYQKLCKMEEQAASEATMKEALKAHNTEVSKLKAHGNIAMKLDALAKAGPDILKCRVAFALHLCHGGISFRSVECPILHLFFSLLKLDCKRLLGTRKQMSALFQLLHTYYKRQFRHTLESESVKALSFTCDSWLDNSSLSYIGLTVHYLSTDFQLHHRVVEVFPFDASQTADALANHFQERVSSHFPGDLLIHNFTTDNGANYVAAMRQFVQEDHFPCFVHTLQLAVRDALKRDPWPTVLASVNTIARATREVKSLREALKSKLTSYKKIPKFIQTRWSSEYKMITEFCALFPTLYCLKLEDSLPSADISDLLTETLIRNCKEFMDIFQIFDEFTTKSQSQRNLIIVEIPTWIQSIQTHLESCSAKYASSLPLTATIQVLQSAMHTRFEFVFNSFNAVTYACALHPNFSEVNFATADIRDSVNEKLADVYKLLHPKVSISIVRAIVPMLRVELQAFKGKVTDSLNAAQTFWKNVEEPFGMFRDLARTVLAAQPTSVCSETTFSASGFIKSKFRSRMSAVVVNQMTVLRQNVPKDAVPSFVDEFCTFVNSTGILVPSDIPGLSDNEDSDDEEIELHEEVVEVQDDEE
jgi:hypothetical protein